jgi:hypothetical protein
MPLTDGKMKMGQRSETHSNFSSGEGCKSGHPTHHTYDTYANLCSRRWYISTAPQQSTLVPGTATGNLREFLTNVLQINGWMLEAQQAPLKVPHPRKLCLDCLSHINSHTRHRNTGTATTGDTHIHSTTT